jgi:hypothetical protein
MTSKRRDIVLLSASLCCLYILPHFMELLVPVGAGFAVVLIGSSRPTFARRQLLRYAAYIAISVGTYFILFQDQPWEFLFGWMPGEVQEFSGVPVSPCSVIMAFAGWLLLSGRTKRRAYLMVTLLIQIPLSMVIHVDAVDSAFELLAKVLRYTGEYTDAEQAWQFVWMLNYYLPIYRWSRREGPA